ncbi:hypothetical protein D9M72_575190 [compost metagenome]
MPSADTRKPPPKQHAAVNMVRRGPTFSSHLPANAAEMPRKKIASENTQPSVVSCQSPGADCVTPRIRVSGSLKTEKA